LIRTEIQSPEKLSICRSIAVEERRVSFAKKQKANTSSKNIVKENFSAWTWQGIDHQALNQGRLGQMMGSTTLPTAMGLWTVMTILGLGRLLSNDGTKTAP
jgi:hypothetical protein